MQFFFVVIPGLVFVFDVFGFLFAIFGFRVFGVRFRFSMFRFDYFSVFGFRGLFSVFQFLVVSLFGVNFVVFSLIGFDFRLRLVVSLVRLRCWLLGF